MNTNPSQLTPFNHEAFGEVRSLVIDGNPYFVAKDIATALGYRDSVNAIKTHCKGVVKRHLFTSTGKKEVSCIPQADVIRLAMRSKLPGAERFEAWVCEEVIPTILRTGSYTMPGAIAPSEVAAIVLAQVLPIVADLQEFMGRTIGVVEQLKANFENRIFALESAARRPHYDEPVADATFDALVSAMRAPKRAPRQRHAVSMEERRILAAHRIAEALLAHRGKSFNVTFQEIVRIGRELGLDDFQFEGFSDRFPEKGTPSMQSSLGKLVNRLLNGQTFVVDGKEWSFVKSSKARGSVYRAIREN